jgi:4-hydroxy-2-oxoheptanedioate aldolase
LKLKPNKLKHFFKNNETQIGVWNCIPDTYVAEILAGSGYDWIVIDGEHAPFDFRTIITQLQVYNQFDIPILVRPHKGDENYIKQLLDAGAQSLIIPMVETAVQAIKMAQAMRYPPSGIRGVGTAMARAAQWNRVDNYFAEANKEMCIIVQVESLIGIKNLNEILAIPEIDGVFIGPADLAASMGFLGNADNLEVQKVIENAIITIRKAGKIAGIMALDKTLAEKYIGLGANMVAVAIDSLLLANIGKETANKFKNNQISKISNTKY